MDDVIDFGEGRLCRAVPVKVRPAANDRIERLNQPFLRFGPGFLHDVPGLAQKRFDAFGGRLRQELVPILPDAVTEEREPFPNVHDTRLLGSYLETALPQECKNHGQDLILQLLSRVAGDDPVVGVANEMHFGSLGEALLEETLEAVEHHIRQCGRSDTPLRGSLFGRVQDFLVDISRLQPLPQDGFVHRDVVHEPRVADRVETAAYVAFQYPLRRYSPRQKNESLMDGIGRGTVGPKPIRVRIRRLLRNGDECLKVQRLHRPVVHGGDRQRSKLAVFLRNVDSPKGEGSVSSPFQHFDGSDLLLRGLPDDSVDSRSSLSLVGGDPPDGQNAGRQRAGQNPLQGFDPARFSFPVRLRDTELELFDVLAEPLQTIRFEKIRCQRSLRSVVLGSPRLLAVPLRFQVQNVSFCSRDE